MAPGVRKRRSVGRLLFREELFPGRLPQSLHSRRRIAAGPVILPPPEKRFDAVNNLPDSIAFPSSQTYNSPWFVAFETGGGRCIVTSARRLLYRSRQDGLIRDDACPDLQGRYQTMPLTANCERATFRDFRDSGRQGRASALVGLLVAAGLVLSGPVPARGAEPTAALTKAAQQVFTRVCTQCHGADGKGTPARPTMPPIPDFTSRAWQQSRSDIQLMISILDGKDRLMPPNRGLISDDLARALVSKVRTFAPAPPVVVVTPPPKPATEPTTTPGQPKPGPAVAIVVPEYKPTGDFPVDFDSLSRRFEALHRQAQELASAPTSTPPVTAPPVTTPPVIAPPVTAPPTAALPEKPAEAPPEQPSVASVPISERPFTPEDVARGRELFLGSRPLANHGTACVACHAVNRGEARDGGRLGPDLTKAYERLGGRTGLSAHLWAPTSPTMRPAYREHALQPDEVLSLAAYLEDTDRQAAEDTSPLRLKFVLLSVGGAVLALGAVSSLWASRSRRGEPAPATTIDTGTGR